ALERQLEAAAVQLDPVIAAMVVKFLDRRLLKPQSAVVAVQFHITEETPDGVESRKVAVAGNDLEVRAFPKLHRRAEVSDDERDGLSEVPVGRIPHQPGAGEGVRGDDHGVLIDDEGAAADAANRAAGSTIARMGIPVRASPPITASSRSVPPACRSRRRTYSLMFGSTRMPYIVNIRRCNSRMSTRLP